MNQPGSRGYPLAAVFLLIAAAAVLLAMLRWNTYPVGKRPPTMSAQQWMQERSENRWIEMAASSAGGILAGGVLGMLIGSYRRGGWKGFFIDAAAGSAVGMLAMPLVVFPTFLTGYVYITSLAGSALILLLGAAAGWRARRRSG